jgi:TRAP-type C4-dicarboxylate transport system permease small subunit
MTKKLVGMLSYRFSNWMEIVAGFALIVVMLLTGGDIVGRSLGHPIPGTYEIVSFAGGLVIGLAVPVTSRVKGHVIVDLLLDMVSARTKAILIAITRLMGTALFLLMGYAIIKMGSHLSASGEVTPVLRIPFYPVAYAMGGAFFVEALMLVADMLQTGGAKHE